MCEARAQSKERYLLSLFVVLVWLCLVVCLWTKSYSTSLKQTVTAETSHSIFFHML